MTNYFKITVGILLILSASRFIPHPPNFTSLIALSFYVPLIFGIKFIPIIVISFLITDLFIGFHSTLMFTWGSVIIIGLISKYFSKNIYYRISGALTGCLIFYIVTNFGVWILGSYGYSIEGFLTCYILALPFFGYTLISTIIFSSIIETVHKFNFFKKFKVFQN